VLVVNVQIEVVETMSGQPMIRVSNSRTIQVPGMQVLPQHGDLVATEIEKVAVEVRDEAMEQARTMFERAP
jgi:hypothetical protein